MVVFFFDQKGKDMKQHLDLMRDILENGDVKGDRTGVGTISLFGGMMKFSLQHGFWPIPTTREVAHEKIASELEWMLKGIVSVKWLKDNNNGIWNAWMGEQSGTIGPMYGEQWRNFGAALSELSGEDEKKLTELLEKYVEGVPFISPEGAVEVMKDFLAEKTKLFQDGGRGGVDQLSYVINELKNNPDSRRICVSVWHAGLLPDTKMSPKENADNGKMALAPCHSMWQVGSSDLSDMEILRQIAYRDERFIDDIESTIQHNRHMDSVSLSKLIRQLTNVWMSSQDWLVSKHPIPLTWEDVRLYPNNRPYDIVADYAFNITEVGQSLIDEYRISGKPVRKLHLLCYARKHVRH
jgi:thymidylate synthase